MMTAKVDISIVVDGWDREPDAERLVMRAIEAAQTRLGRSGETAETSVVLAGDAEVRELNAQWRGKDSPTNVLSFPTPPGPAAEMQLGEIIIALETVAREAVAEHKPFPDHLSHLVVHGYLHLVGFDHLEDDEAEKMEQLEREILASLGLPDPYATGHPL